MFINPQTAIDNGWISGFSDPKKQLQPNAIDFTLDRLFSIDESKTFSIDEDDKVMRGGIELFPDANDKWALIDHAVFDGMSNMYLDVPDGVAAMLVIRSTFNRNGIFLTSGLYDSGFKGHIGFAIHNMSGKAIVKQGTRVGQVIFVDAESAKQYAGGYNHAKGTHHTE